MVDYICDITLKIWVSLFWYKATTSWLTRDHLQFHMHKVVWSNPNTLILLVSRYTFSLLEWQIHVIICPHIYIHTNNYTRITFLFFFYYMLMFWSNVVLLLKYSSCRVTQNTLAKQNLLPLLPYIISFSVDYPCYYYYLLAYH